MKRISLYLGADHAGYKLKEKLKTELIRTGVNVIDLSPLFQGGDDYPLHARKVADAVADKKTARGILICGSGVGMAMAANRVNGIRAFEAHDIKEVKLGREHNNANIMALSGWKLSARQAMNLIRVFLKTPFSKAARHGRRVKQIG